MHATPDLVRQCDNIIFDLSDVLFTRDMPSSQSQSQLPALVPSGNFRRMLNSATWYEYEKGKTEEEECYARLAAEYSLPTSDISTTIRAWRASLRADREMFALLYDLKARAGVRLFAMSNIPSPDWDVFKTKAAPQDWALFDGVFISASAGERKPNLGFYRKVIDSTGIDPLRTAFVDSKVANALTAMSLGMKGFVFTGFEDLSRSLWQLFRDPVAEAEQWLRIQPKPMWSVTDTGVTIQDNFAQLLILELTGDRTLVEVGRPARLSNFFAGDGVLTTSDYPDDLDTTSLACTVLDYFTPEVKNEIMDTMLNYKNDDGIMQLYFADNRPRFDACICATILGFFSANNRAHDLPETTEFVYNVLYHRAYELGTTYYLGGDIFLFFLSRLLRLSGPSSAVQRRFGVVFAERVQERFGLPGDALALAMRVLAAASVGIRDVQDYRRLLSLQEDDGSWPLGWMYIYGLSGVRIGNKALTTAMALSAKWVSPGRATWILPCFLLAKSFDGAEYNVTRMRQARTTTCGALHVFVFRRSVLVIRRTTMLFRQA
ncbi:hypothetical protein GSI_09301 [Ganoderma sinense ZZ0214-1]|uniref:HAD-like protein n=1 Tax=Ganoderma sinense ZZ0214-1 TaxID=1077348 RepID=A0A2G8S650_9APHY|nr:hypothetical protein GSI_09301 [Ganoderma sinense ZZ0214-1]